MSSRLPVLAGIGAAAMGGSMVVATRFLAADMDPWGQAIYRYGIACLVLLLLMPFQKRSVLSRQKRMEGIIAGLLFYGLFPLGLAFALEYTSAGRAALVLAAMPVFALLMAAALKIEGLNIGKVTGIVLAIAGLSLGLGIRPDRLMATAGTGEWVMLGMAILAAAFNLQCRRVLASAALCSTTCWMVCSGWLLLVALAWVTGNWPGIPVLDASGWLALVYLGVLAGAGLALLFHWSIKTLNASTSSIMIAINPLTALVLAALFLGEPLRPAVFVGLLLVLSGVLCVRRSAVDPMHSSAVLRSEN